ncbi:sugar transferase [Actinophytocola sp.]|uniref:sugar transferase n=1 Tax=Actinophytocola sp. TaxID=1872138 RepID=UPI002ED45E0B
MTSGTTRADGMAFERGRRDTSARRLFDILVTVIAIALLLPLLGVVALLVRWRLGTPVLFRQRRSGRDGEEFAILKFRTMRQPSYPDEPDRDRQTRLGAALRRVSIDELPQLVNILRGEMSLIGPRPTLPEQVRAYDRRQRGRLAVRPGLTGWAQVRGRNRLSWAERIELDLWYIEHRSWRLDAWILVLTVVALVRPRGITGHGGVNPGFPSPGGSPS